MKEHAINSEIKAIIGLGNPGSNYYHHRHSIGFQVVDEYARSCSAEWQERDNMAIAMCNVNNKSLLLIKPLTYMNNSGDVVPFLLKKGIKPENILVVHDELEKPFGNVSIRFGGSARGHNGLRSIIERCGKDFARLRLGIGRPEHKEDVGTFVLSSFSEPQQEVDQLIHEGVKKIDLLGQSS